MAVCNRLVSLRYANADLVSIIMSSAVVRWLCGNLLRIGFIRFTRNLIIHVQYNSWNSLYFIKIKISFFFVLFCFFPETLMVQWVKRGGGTHISCCATSLGGYIQSIGCQARYTYTELLSYYIESHHKPLFSDRFVAWQITWFTSPMFDCFTFN